MTVFARIEGLLVAEIAAAPPGYPAAVDGRVIWVEVTAKNPQPAVGWEASGLDTLDSPASFFSPENWVFRPPLPGDASVSYGEARGADIATAFLLSAQRNFITCNTHGAGVRLSGLWTAGVIQSVTNRGPHPMRVYPPVTGQIENLNTHTPAILAPKARADFYPSTPLQWAAR